MMCVINQRIKAQVFNLCRLHISVPKCGEARVMKKVLGGSAKKKFKYHESPLLPSPTVFSKGTFEGKKSTNSKRATVLNKLFMRYITDLMASGECSSAFLGYGIEINRVQITPDFTCVKVYWIARGTEKDDIVEDVLHKNVGSLRHELAQLKVVGVIPKLRFVKDKQYAQATEVDRLLSKADFGDDYVPVDTVSKLKTRLELNTSLDPSLVKQIQTLDSLETEIQEEPLPTMPNNIFGLNHSDILERIQKSRTRSHALHRLQPEDEPQKSLQTVNENPVQYHSVYAEREAFKEFLRKRQILKSKTNKEDKNYRPEMEFLQEEWEQEHERRFNSYNFENTIEDKDFIDEDVYDDK